MKIFRWYALFAVLFISLFVLGACSQDDEQTSSEGSKTEEETEEETEVEAESSEEPKSGGIYKFAFPANPETLDPHKSPNGWVQYQMGLVYNKLLTFETGEGINAWDMNIVPDLAEDWEVSDDELEYTFHLREANFHDIEPVNGRQLDADDVLATFERIQEIGHQANLLEYVETMEAPDEKTVVFTLSQPFAPFLNNLANHYMWILPKEAVNDEVDLNRTAIGTGPFMLEEWDNNVELTYIKNPDFYEEGKPYLDGVRVIIMPDPSATLSALRSEEVESIMSTISPEDYENIEQSGELQKTATGKSAAPITLSINMEKEPFDDLNVRKAISMAIDTQGIVDSIYGGGEIGGPVNPTMDDFVLPLEERESLQPYDPDEAKELLVEAGYPDGIDITLLTTTMYGEQMVRSAQWIVEDLKAIGINADIDILEAAAYMDKWTSLDYDIGVGFTMVSLEPDEALSKLYHSEGSHNWFGINDPKIDEMIEEQRMIMDEDERVEYLHELERYILENTVNPIFVGAPQTKTFVGKNVRNPESHMGYGWVHMKNVWLDE